MTADRIALICDCEGNVAALHAALRAMKQHAPDSIVGAGDILASPFSPDPPSETIALLRSEPVESIWPRSPIYDAKVSDAALRMLAKRRCDARAMRAYPEPARIPRPAA